MMTSTQFARHVFHWAGLYGIASLLPMYFLETRLGLAFPPPLNHPEHFYGFLGVSLAWQLAFLLIARDVPRFRPLMPVAVAEKLLFVAALLALHARGRVADLALLPAALDFFLAVLFIVAYRASRRTQAWTGKPWMETAP